MKGELTVYGRWLMKHGHMRYFRDMEDGKLKQGWELSDQDLIRSRRVARWSNRLFLRRWARK